MAGDSVTQVLYPEEGGPEIAVVKNQELLLRKKAHKKLKKIKKYSLTKSRPP